MGDKIVEKFNKRHGHGAWGSSRYEYERLEWQAAQAATQTAMQKQMAELEKNCAILQATVKELTEKCNGLTIEIQECKRSLEEKEL
jgi:uncharacterized coiled-coil protein SlyX